jgi:hypothetical protein
VIVAGTGVDALGRAFVAAGAAEGVGFGLEQAVEGLLDRLADDLV